MEGKEIENDLFNLSLILSDYKLHSESSTIIEYNNECNYNEDIQSEIISVKQAIDFCNNEDNDNNTINDISNLLTIIEMSIQINILESSEFSEILGILNQKSHFKRLSRNCLALARTTTNSTKFHNQKAKTISLAGKVLFNCTSTAKSSLMIISN